MTHDPFLTLGNFIGDAMLIGVVLLVAALPVIGLHLAVRQARKALLSSEVQITKGRQCERKS